MNIICIVLAAVVGMALVLIVDMAITKIFDELKIETAKE